MICSSVPAAGRSSELLVAILAPTSVAIQTLILSKYGSVGIVVGDAYAELNGGVGVALVVGGAGGGGGGGGGGGSGKKRKKGGQGRAVQDDPRLTPG